MRRCKFITLTAATCASTSAGPGASLPKFADTPKIWSRRRRICLLRLGLDVPAMVLARADEVFE
jgi:hypothetical protein